jgi:hypothetical protein
MKKSAILSTLAMVLVVVVALAGATYAWFSLGSEEVTVTSGNITATATGGLSTDNLVGLGNVSGLWTVKPAHADPGTAVAGHKFLLEDDEPATSGDWHEISFALKHDFSKNPEVAVDVTIAGVNGALIANAVRVALWVDDEFKTVYSIGGITQLGIGAIGESTDFKFYVWIQGGHTAATNQNSGGSFTVKIDIAVVDLP